MMIRWHFAAMTCLSLTMAARGQPVPPPVTTQPDQKAIEQAYRELPWAVRLGLRSQQVTNAFPVIDRVVLVPDAATYIDEIAKWSPQGRWPVLMEDDRLTAMFVRRFKPAQLIRRESAGPAVALPADKLARQELLESIVVRTFGGDPARQTIRNAFDQQHYVPPGVVISSVDDPAWTAAMALAAGHGQPLLWLDDSFGGPNDELDDQPAQQLIHAIEALIAQQKYSFDALGDDIDAITICRSIANRASIKLPPMAQPPVPAPHNQGPLALSDLIGRHHDGTRFACTGWIFGSEVRCAYMAMCSLFLPREQVWLCNAYPTTSDWAAYSTEEAAATLAKSGFQARQSVQKDANESAWQLMLLGGVSADVIVMNTKGNADFFDLYTGRGTPLDVPILNTPAALHLIHSWSMKSPLDLETVGAQWLDQGVYAAVGSCWEPLLQAFVPPSMLAKRWVNLVPFLVSARWWEGEPGIFQPWRVITIGDPLMLCGPPAAPGVKPRIAKTANYGTDLDEQVKTLIRGAQGDKSGSDYVAAIKILNMRAKDDVAIGLWRVADQNGRGSVAARPTLAPLFRSHDVDGFLHAWDQLADPDAAAKDMLWDLLLTRLNPTSGLADRQILQRLESAIRQPMPQIDVQRLASHLEAAFGRGHIHDLIQRQISATTSSSAKQALAELLRKY